MPRRTDFISVWREQKSATIASENRSGLPGSKGVEPTSGIFAFRLTRFLNSVTWSQMVQGTGNGSTDARDRHANGGRSQYA